MFGLINRLLGVIVIVLLAGNALAGPINFHKRSAGVVESSAQQVDANEGQGDVAAEAEREPAGSVADTLQEELHFSTEKMLMVLLIAGCGVGIAVLIFIVPRIRKELRFNTAEPASLCALEATVEYTLHFYGNKRMGKNGYRVLKCPELKQWIVMRAEPAAIFLQRRQVSTTGLTRLSPTRPHALPGRQEVQSLFETEALLVTLNPRRTFYMVHPCDCRRRPFFSENLSSHALYRALKCAEGEGLFILRRLPLGRWVNCPRQRPRDHA
jgi:hypothetical protein